MAPATTSDHKNASALLEEGRKLYNQKLYDQAKEYFRNAIADDEAYAKAHYFLGLALDKLDDAPAAIKSWKRATEVDPGDPIAYKAERKIRYVDRKVKQTIDELAERVRKK